jgi:DNA-binding response OmpR family regulator
MNHLIERDNRIETKNTRSVDRSSISILLAESDPSEIDRIRSNIDREFQHRIKIAHNYQDLLKIVTAEQPQLVILGKIDNSNYVTVCQECHKIWKNLPIVMLSKQTEINDSFRKLVKNCGLADVVSQNPGELNQRLQQMFGNSVETVTLQDIGMILSIPHESFIDDHIEENFLMAEDDADELSIDQILVIATSQSVSEQLTNEILSEPKLIGKTMLSALEEIILISNNYFGPLAQGNYWRKSHARIVCELPFISNWSVDHFSKISCSESTLTNELTNEEIQNLRVWVQMFIEECERIINDFRSILNNSDISPLAKDLLANS